MRHNDALRIVILCLILCVERLWFRRLTSHSMLTDYETPMLDGSTKNQIRPSRRCALMVLYMLIFGLLWFGPDPSSSNSLRRPGKMQSWEKRALAKKQGELDKIPEDWLLAQTVLEDSQTRNVIAGTFIESLLDEDTLRITSLDPVEIVASTCNGSRSAYEVVKAFSKRAAYGHQMVCYSSHLQHFLTLRRASIC